MHLIHRPGEAQVDFKYALGKVSGGFKENSLFCDGISLLIFSIIWENLIFFGKIKPKR